jgi:hypothetical protein
MRCVRGLLREPWPQKKVIEMAVFNVAASFSLPVVRLQKATTMYRKTSVKIWLVHGLRITLSAGHKNPKFYYN